MKRNPLPVLEGERLPFDFGPILETLSYYDGPLIFTVHDTVDHKLLLVTWYDCDEQFARYLAVEITPERLQSIKDNKLSLFQAFNVDPLYCCDYGAEKRIIATRISMQQIPRNTLPEDDAFLQREE